MPVVEFSNKDLKFGQTVEPAWYLVKIDSVGEEPAKTSEKGPSTNYPVEATILQNADTGDKTYAEVPVRWNFNSKAIGFAVGFLKAFGVDVQAGQRMDLAAAEGRYLEVFIGNKEYNSRTINNVDHKYRPAKVA
jgi:hypothetical protein